MTSSPTLFYEKTLAIAWGDMDALGHVNNARYFDYFQEARIEWLRQLQISMTETKGPVVVHVACSFLKPVIYPATVTIKSKVHSPGHTSITMDHELYQGETLMAQGLSKIVWVDYMLNKSTPLPEPIRRLFS
jgi:acyl-CoA thioester hydrolase